MFDGIMADPLDKDFGYTSPMSLEGFVTTLTRMGERVATLEADNKSLKADTTQIRSNIHDINNTLQSLVGAEQLRASAIRGLTAEIDKMTEAVTRLMGAHERQAGVWWAIVRVCAVVVGAFTLIGALGSAIGWMLSHHVGVTVQ